MGLPASSRENVPPEFFYFLILDFFCMHTMFQERGEFKKEKYMEFATAVWSVLFLIDFFFYCPRGKLDNLSWLSFIFEQYCVLYLSIKRQGSIVIQIIVRKCWHDQINYKLIITDQNSYWSSRKLLCLKFCKNK